MDIQTSETKLYEVLRDLFGKDKAEEAVLNVKKMVNTEVVNETKNLATKEELYAVKDELKSEIYVVKDELKNEIRAVRDEIYVVKDELKSDISRIYRSIYFVSIVQFLAIVGSIIAIIQFALK